MGQSGSADRSRPDAIPATQKQLVLAGPCGKGLETAEFLVRDAPVPQPRSGQVLVRMAAAPVNPSDYGSWMAAGVLPTKEGEYPKCVGNEGSGTVVASGGGFMANGLVGKKVGVVAREQGSYQQYVCVDAMRECFPIDDAVPVEDAASFFVNPYTAVGIIDTVKQQHGCSAFIHTAAASQLGQMLVKLAPSQGVTVVNVVRREEQAEMLRKLGAQHVVVQTEGWEDRLRAKISELGVTVAFDAVAGDSSGAIVALMPDRSTTYVYGGLSAQPVGNIPIMDMIYRAKKCEGWLLPRWLTAGGQFATLKRIRRASAIVNPGLRPGGWATSQYDDCSMENMLPKLLEMRGSGGFTGRKLRIRLDAVSAPQVPVVPHTG